MVGDGDEGAGGVGVDAAGGVGDDQDAAAEEAEDTGGEDDLGNGVALVGVDAAFHDGDGDTRDGAEEEVAGVADYGGLGEVRDGAIGDGGGVLDRLGEVAEAGAENDGDFWRDVGQAADVVGGGLGSFVGVVHGRNFLSGRPSLIT